MHYKGPLPKILYYCILIALLAILAALFLAERKQAANYSSYYRQKAKEDSRDNLENLNDRDNQDEEDIDNMKDTDEQDVPNDADVPDVSDDVEKEDSEDNPDESTESYDTNVQNEDSNAEAQKIYDTLHDSIKDSLPGIVIWGNAGTADKDAGSLSGELTRIMDDKLLKAVKQDLSDISSLPHIDELDIPVVHMGVSHEGLHEILVRTGVHSLVAGEGYTVAATTEKKDIVLCDEDGNALRFAKQELDKFGKVTIEGVEGHFYAGSVSYDDYHSRLAFGRDADGAEVTAEEGSIIHTEGSELYRNHLPIFFFEEQEDLDIEELIQGVRDTVSLYGKKKYVVIASTSSGSTWDEELSQAFKKHYIQSDKSPADMGKEDYKLLADQVYENLNTQNAFEKVSTAVQEAEKEIGNINKTN